MSYFEDELLLLPGDKKWIYSRIEDIKTAPDGARRWLRDLGKNDFEHAQAVEEYVGKILSESHIKLSPEEVYLLVHSIYIHDVGYRAFSKTHAQQSYEMITNRPESFFINDLQLAKAIALIGLTHGINDFSQIPTSFPIDFLSKTVEFDLRFLGSLLLVGDELDQGYLRVFERPGQYSSHRQNICHIEIGPQIIKIKTQPDSRKQWAKLRVVTDQMQKRLDSVSEVLRKRGIKLEKIDLYPIIWAEGAHLEQVESLPLHQPRKKGQDHLLFLLDRTVLSAEILQRIRVKSTSINVVPISIGPLEVHPLPPSLHYSGIIWTLGEDFSYPITIDLLKMVVQNTTNGGGLLLFPFVAWSVSQGINEIVQELLPVSLKGNWYEGHIQNISHFEGHPITNRVEPFTIENTYEILDVKSDAQCLISDSNGNPFLTIGSYGKGRIAYFNACTHLCFEPRTFISPWQQNPAVPQLIMNTISWICGK